MGLEGLKKWTIDLPYGYYMYKFPYKFPYGHLAGYVWVFPMKVLQTQGSGSGRRAQVDGPIQNTAQIRGNIALCRRYAASGVRSAILERTTLPCICRVYI